MPSFPSGWLDWALAAMFFFLWVDYGRIIISRALYGTYEQKKGAA